MIEKDVIHNADCIAGITASRATWFSTALWEAPRQPSLRQKCSGITWALKSAKKNIKTR